MGKALQKTARAVLARLDGKPTSGKGQSMVELALTLPILLFMLLGMVEVGWLANNYLTLIDVSRSAGRWGSTNNPMDMWLIDNEVRFEYMDCDVSNGTYGDLSAATADDVWQGNPLLGSDYGFTNGAEGHDALQYFDGVACNGVINNFPPLAFDNTRDDIVVSLFAYAVINGRVEVVGRYPPRTNECTEDTADDSGFIHYDDIDNNLRDTGPDNVRGYIFRGNHVVSNQLAGQTGETVDCVGSEFSTAEVESILNQSLTLPPVGDVRGVISSEEIAQVPNGAIILVEIFWHHDQLLGLPLFTILGNPVELHVWSMFPVTGAEPEEARIIRP